jgi:carboxypeptidase Taq
MGSIGYFPTYALGNLYAAQFFAAFAREHPDWPAEIRQGRFSVLREWLREKIHRHGKVHSARELCRRVTGSPLDPAHQLAYLNRKFAEVYGL